MEKTMTIYGAYDADKTIKFEFTAESGHDVYQVADLTAFNACDLTGATKMDEVCALLRDDFFFVVVCTSLTPKKGCLSDSSAYYVPFVDFALIFFQIFSFPFYRARKRTDRFKWTLVAKAYYRTCR